MTIINRRAVLLSSGLLARPTHNPMPPPARAATLRDNDAHLDKVGQDRTKDKARAQPARMGR